MITEILEDDYARELTRVVERLRTMPLTRLAGCADEVFTACGALADLARTAEPGLPGGVQVPRLGDHALPDQLQVLGTEVVATGNAEAMSAAYELLVNMRKALP